MNTKIFHFILIAFFFLSTTATGQNGIIKIVVLGSSTAAGAGPKDLNNAWVNLYRKYVKSKNPYSDVINLAVGGFTTYEVMSTGFIPPSYRPLPDSNHNITKALSLSPDAIIINLPTNDVENGYTISEQINNYSIILDSAAAKNVPVFIATTQPRNLSASERQRLMIMRDSIYSIAGQNVIDFWTDIAADDGTINPKYDHGDGVHLNDAAHVLLASRVEAKDILLHSRDFISFLQVYPNPITENFVIKYFVPYDGNVLIRLFDIKYQEKAILFNHFQTSGFYKIDVNGINCLYKSGILICQIIINSKTQVYTTYCKLLIL